MIAAITTPQGGSKVLSLQITHPAQERLTTPSGSTSPTLSEQWCGFFYAPQEPDKWKCCETGPTVFRPYPRRLEGLTVFADLGCVPFGESKNGFLILDLPDFAVERNVKSEIGFVTLVTFRQLVQYARQPLKK